MEGKSRVLDPVVIGQDDKTELHVQAVIQGGRRHLDIRIWRRGPTGFAPSRNAITLDAADLDALQEGIAELLEASNGGSQVARVVWDKDEGRRLRAETEPFGTRYLARLGFWQRVRDSWKPAGESLVLAADKLNPLQALLRDVRPRLEPEIVHAGENRAEVENAPEDDGPQVWPPPGADWITIGPDRVAFHPRGFRLTAEVEEVGENAHRLIIRQWRREDSLWLTTDEKLRLNLSDLDSVLAFLGELAGDGSSETEGMPEEQIAASGGSTIWIRVLEGDAGLELNFDELRTLEGTADADYDRRLHLPAEYVPQFGRMLWQSRVMLLRRLTGEEREQLLSVEELQEIAERAEALVEIETVDTSPEAHETAPPEAQSPTDEIEPQPAAVEQTPIVSWEPDSAPEPPMTPERRAVSLGDVKLGHFHVFLFLQETEPRELTLQWEGRSLQLPAEHLEEFLSRVRDLYYDALRGRRGRAVTVGTRPAVTVSVHHHGATMYLALDQDLDGKTTHLSFPTGEVPAFLNVTETSVARI
jgi:hypothetical protein